MYFFAVNNAVFLRSRFITAFLKRIRNGKSVGLRAFTLVELVQSSAVGAALIGAKQIKEEIPMDYSKNYKVLFQADL